MLIVMVPGSTQEDAEALMRQIRERGCKPLYLPGTERVVIGAIGDERTLAGLDLDGHPKVESVKPVLAPYKMVSREFHPHDSVVRIGTVPVGGERFVILAGPSCATDSEGIRELAVALKKLGAHCLWGGARGSCGNPYATAGDVSDELAQLDEALSATGLPAVAELGDAADLEATVERVDALWVHERDMQNFRLLKALGRCDKTVILQRGLAAQLKELLLAAEYIYSEGNPNVILCEGGIRTFETATENTLDLSAVPYLKDKTHLPVIVDPTRGTGRRELVAQMSKAALACGADGICVEVDDDPSHAHAGGRRALGLGQFAELVHGLRAFVAARGRTL